jgi:hypothetical protein
MATVAAPPRPSGALDRWFGVGIGLFITLIGLREGGIVVSSPATGIALGDLTTAPRSSRSPASSSARCSRRVRCAGPCWPVSRRARCSGS